VVRIIERSRGVSTIILKKICLNINHLLQISSLR
jgi:hypothetical protein